MLLLMNFFLVLEKLGKNIIKNNIVIITLWKWLETKNLIKQILNTYEKLI